MRLNAKKDKVRIHIEKGPSIEGILMGRSKAHYIVRAATIIKDEHDSFSVDGEVRIPAARVLFYQTLMEVSV